MLFSERKELEEKFFVWVQDHHNGVKPKDCAFNVITFLISINRLKSDNSEYAK